MQSQTHTIPLLSGSVFGAANVDSARLFATASRVMHYTVDRFEQVDNRYDSHLLGVPMSEVPVRAYRRIDSARRQETLLPGSAIIVPMGALHDSVTEGGGSFAMVAVPDDTFRETCNMLEVARTCSVAPNFPERRDDELAALLNQATALVHGGDLARSADLDTCLHRVAVRLVSAYSGASRRGRVLNHGLAPHQVARVTEYVQAHMAEPLRIDDLAAVASLSRHHFLRQFRRSTGRTPAQFIIEQRMALARSLLMTGREPVSTLAARCGFSTEAHFSHTFRRRCGQTPSQFRQHSGSLR